MLCCSDNNLRKAVGMLEHVQDLILDNLLEHVIFYDLEMKIRWANRAARESTGLPPEALRGRRCYEIWYGRIEPCEGCPVRKTLNSGRFEEGKIETPDCKTWLVQATPALDREGAVSGVVELALDITELTRSEKRKAQADALSDLVNATLDPVIVFNARGVCVFANRAFEKMFYLKPRDFIGRSFMEIEGFDLQSHDEIMRYMPLFRHAAMDGSFGPVEMVIARKDGTNVRVSATAGSIKDESNKTANLVVVLHDISKRLEIEDALKAENDALRASIQATVVLDGAGWIVYADAAFLKMWDYGSEGDVVERPGEDLWQDKEAIRTAAGKAAAEDRWEGELVARNSDGVNFRAALNIATVKGLTGQLWSIRRIE